MELNQVSTGNHGEMLNAYLYDTTSIQDRLFQLSQLSSVEVEQTADGKIEQADKGLPQEGHDENEHMAENAA
jgi:hypothetical protein